MLKYVISRLLQAIPTMIGVTMISFLIIHLVPGSPVYTMLGPKASPRLIALFNQEYGVNLPLPIQYVRWLGQVLQGNLGISYFQNQTVSQLISVALPRTLAIIGIGVVVAHVISIAMGTYQAWRVNKWDDHTLTSFSYFFYSMPTFWLGLVMIMIFSFYLSWFPPGGLANPGQPPVGFTVWISHISLPIITLVLLIVAGWGRYMRTAMTETLVQDYIRTARAKGLSEWVVLFKHGLRNSVLPLITFVGFSIPGLFAGNLFIEEVFNYPGMGLLTYNAVINHDYPIVLATVLIVGLLTVAGNLIADLLYAFVDPRVQYT